MGRRRLERLVFLSDLVRVDMKGPMKIYLGIKYHRDNANRGIIEALSRHLESQGHSVFCVARDVEEWAINLLTRWN